MKGKIKGKLDKQGYGFIIPNDPRDGKDLFFHATQCATPFIDLNEGDEVVYGIQDSPKGKRAVDVERLVKL
jgi:cold shock CspA family protein